MAEPPARAASPVSTGRALLPPRPAVARPTGSARDRLLSVGLAMLLEHGYHGLGTQAVLDAAQAPKGSFYHHFKDKQDFALQVVDEYMIGVHAALDACLADDSLDPLDRVRSFFETVQTGYSAEGYLGCLLGGLGQELSGADRVFAVKIESCLSYIASRLAETLEEARGTGALRPDADPALLASLLVDCWEGAALRSRLTGSPAPLVAMLDFYFDSARVPAAARGSGTRA